MNTAITKLTDAEAIALADQWLDGLTFRCWDGCQKVVSRNPFDRHPYFLCVLLAATEDNGEKVNAHVTIDTVARKVYSDIANGTICF